MNEILHFLNDSQQVIGIIRTKGGQHEPATVRLVSEAFEQRELPYLIIHKEELDRFYGPGSEERALTNPGVCSTTIVHQKINEVKEAQGLCSAQLKDVWTSYEIEDLKAYRDQLLNHKIVLTLGNDSGASYAEIKASKRLCDLIILTMNEEDAHSWEVIGRWAELATKAERGKLIIACWSQVRAKRVLKLMSVDEFEAIHKEHPYGPHF